MAGTDRLDETIGQRIQTLREERGWSPTKLASEAGISAQALNGIESGASKSPSFVNGLRIARALGVDPELLAGLPQREDRSASGGMSVNQPDLDPLRVVAGRVDALTRIVLRAFGDRVTDEEKADLQAVPSPPSQRSPNAGS